MRNVFEAILQCGHDGDFVPAETEEFCSHRCPLRGSRAKLAVFGPNACARACPLWHPLDRSDYSGLTGAERLRD